MIPSVSRVRSLAWLIWWLTAAGVAAVACGSGVGSSAEDFQQISESGATYIVDDLSAIGFKQSRAYSTDGLPGATDAVYGFWRVPGGDPVDIEFRFYPSHADAVSLGQAPADEGTGRDAVLDASSAVYKEGVKDRRIITGAGVGGGARSGIGPKYADYAVFDNIVLLCQGSTSGQSLERCSLVIDALDALRSP